MKNDLVMHFFCLVKKRYILYHPCDALEGKSEIIYYLKLKKKIQFSSFITSTSPLPKMIYNPPHLCILRNDVIYFQLTNAKFFGRLMLCGITFFRCILFASPYWFVYFKIIYIIIYLIYSFI